MIDPGSGHPGAAPDSAPATGALPTPPLGADDGVTARRPAVLTVALWLVGIGAAIAALDIVANTVGVATVIWWARDNIESTSLIVLLLVVPPLANLAVWVAVMLLRRRTARRDNAARGSLAGVMFGCVPGAVLNFTITEVFLLIFALSSWGGGDMPAWTGGTLLGSMIADGVLLLLALAAGILLVLPAASRWTARPTGDQPVVDPSAPAVAAETSASSAAASGS